MKKIDLKTNMISEDEIKNADPESLFYGDEKLELIYISSIDKILKAAGVGDNNYDDEIEEYVVTEGSDVYLGYVPSLDTFLVGVELIEDMNTGSCSVEFRVSEDGFDVEIVNINNYVNEFYYHNEEKSGFNKMKNIYRDVVEIKLDKE